MHDELLTPVGGIYCLVSTAPLRSAPSVAAGDVRTKTGAYNAVRLPALAVAPSASVPSN